MSFAVSATTAVASVAAAGVSAYGQAQAAAAQGAAARANAYISEQSSIAQAQSALYSANMNYAVSMAQSQAAANNATILFNFAKNQELNGNEQISRLSQAQEAQQKGLSAAYGASGVTSDSGSSLQVAAYTNGQAQLKKMDTAYAANQSAMNTNFEGEMQQYQSKLTAASAQQYQYAASMAQWQESAAKAGYSVAIQNANAVQSADSIAAAGTLLSGVAGAASSGIGTAGAITSLQNSGVI